MKKLLIGHVSEETAFIQPDYPYSFNLRCMRRVWIETRKGYGQRLVTQTLNPKTGRWNKAKPGGYSTLIVMYLDEETNHLEHDCLSGYDNEEKVEAFANEYAEALMGEYEKGTLRYMRAALKVSKTLTYEVKVGKEAEKVPSMNEQARMFGQLVRRELIEEDFRDADKKKE